MCQEKVDINGFSHETVESEQCVTLEMFSNVVSSVQRGRTRSQFSKGVMQTVLEAS